MEEKKVKKTESEEPVVKGKVTVENKNNKLDNKKIMMISIIVIAIVVCIAIICYVSSYLKTPYYAAKKSFNALKKGDITTINETMPYDELMNSLLEKIDARQEMSELDKSCFEKFEYTIDNTTTEGDTATITISTTNKNFRNALTKWSQNMYQKFISGQEINNDQGEVLLVDCLADESIGTMSVTGDITLNKVDGKWRVIVDDNLKNVVFPGLNEVTNSVEDIIVD